MIYDTRDRLVMSQDSVLRASGKWMFIKYDQFNRLALTGIKVFSRTQSQIQAAFRSYTGTMYESMSGSDYTLNNSFPSAYAVTTADLLTKTYYDDYTWNPPVTYASVTGYTDHTQAVSVKGLVTGKKVKVLSTGTWLTSVSYYDKYGRLLVNYQSNPENGYNCTSTVYNFTNQPVKQKVSHKLTNSSVAETTEEWYSYDHAGRLTRTEHSYKGATPVILSQNTYDELGRLSRKDLHNSSQLTDYRYNIRDWLTMINDPSEAFSNSKLFAMKLYYQDVSELAALDEQAQYNGNISGIRWRNDNTIRSAYAFKYDGINRLRKGDFGIIRSLSNVADTVKYDLPDVTYDQNGNIKTLIRKNNLGTVKEDLTYTYAGNQLASLTGTYNALQISSGTFAYDGNGNTTGDNLRGVTTTYYEGLNLPKRYSKGSQYAQYDYDAEGVKWQKTAVTAGSTTMKYYGNFIYQGTTLDRVLTSEGFYQAGKYHYYLKDHLGNTRMVISYDSSGSLSKDQRMEYYPFGSMFSENNLDKNKYLYNGKELNKEFFENYDYGARMYDPALARWHSVDPLAEAYYEHTGYGYVRNNPIAYFDPNGMYDLYVNGKLVSGDEKKNYQDQYGLPDDSSDDEGDEKKGYQWDRSLIDKNNPASAYSYYTDAYAYHSAMNGLDGLTPEQMSEVDDDVAIAMLSLIPIERAVSLYKIIPQRLRGKALKIIYNRIGATGRYGERILGALGGESQKYFRTTFGKRFVDQFVNGVAHESKVGYTSLTESVRNQILKDAELMNTGQVNKSIWHFFKSPVTGKSGASKNLIDFMNKNGIDYIIH